MPKIDKAMKDSGLATEAQPTPPPAQAGHNGGVNWEAAAAFVVRVEEINDQKATIMGEAMAKCKALSDDVAEILNEAKEAGIAKKAVRAVVKARALEDKAAAQRDALEDEHQDAFDNLRLALGDFADTELGAAAVRREGGDPTIDALTS